jgi:hypothetical protein
MISLEKSIRTDKVNVDRAAQLQSDRFLNQSKALCYSWTGLDTTGREVCQNSFAQKSAGCNLSDDRVDVENDLRPRYYNYANLSAYGLEAPNSTTAVIGGLANYGIDIGKNLSSGTRYQDKIDI